jgi:tRNA(fMet)-specific endonuclease VapC
MSLYLLDTDTISLAQFGHPAVLQQLANHAPDVALSVISLQEQFAGWLAALTRTRTHQQLAEVYQRLVSRMFPVWKQYQLLAFPEPAILRFEQLVALRLNVGKMDLRIAAIALEYGAVVVTRNQRDFGRVPGLVTEDWTV